MSEATNKNAGLVHLHNHSYYSLLDGYSSPEDLASVAGAMGFKALAITDHGSCAAMLSFQKACKSNNIKPILGQEFYSTENAQYKEKDAKSYHLILLAKNSIGLKNLMKLSTLAEVEGKYKNPKIDFSMLEKYHEGLICSSACCVGEIPYKIYNNQEEEAEKIVKKYKDLFGGDFYIEIMVHKYFETKKKQEEREKLLARKLYALAKKYDIKSIATNDCHYAAKADAKYQDILLAMQTLDNMKDPERFTFGSDEFYLKSYDEMMQYYSHAPELLGNTLEIAEKIEEDAKLNPSKDLLPNFDLPEGFNSEVEYIKSLVKDGMRSKGLLDKPDYRERIKYEMKAIIDCGYVRYFLVLWDIINYTRQQKIRLGIGRGSAGGSLVLYVLGVTGLDPIKYGLLFERFINPERVSPPDVDLDFDHDRRDEIRDYIINKYGQDYCSKIGTYNSLKPKSSIRYGAKALDIGKDWEEYQKALKEGRKIEGKTPKLDDFKYSLKLADFIAKQVPFGPSETIESSLQNSEDFKNSMARYPLLLDACRHIEGVLVSPGVHAAGIVVCKDPVAQHVPMRLNKGQICTQFDKDEVEELGLLKFDLLALKTLTVIENTIQLIKERHGIVVDIDNIPDYDPKLFALLNGKYPNMDNRGIFQFENYGMSKLLKNISVDSFEDMAVATALYRPGPLGAGVHDLYCDYKHKRKKIQYLHPKMGEVLGKTYGLMCFSEDQIVYTNNTPEKIIDITNKHQVYTRKNDELLINNPQVDSFCNGEKDVYEYKLSNGYKIKSTKDHKILDFHGNYVEIDDIFTSQTNIPYAVSDLGETPYDEIKAKKCYSIRLSSPEKIPFEYLQNNREYFKAIIAGYLDHDGRLGKNISFSSKNENILSGIAYLLWRMGYHTERSNHSIHVYNSEKLWSEIEKYSVIKHQKHLKNEGTNIKIDIDKAIEIILNKKQDLSLGAFCKKYSLNRGTISRILKGKKKWCKYYSIKNIVSFEEILKSICLYIVDKKHIGKVNVYDISMPNNTEHNFVISPGIVVHNCYQEDFMKVAQVLAGFTKGQSDTLRKIVGKKKPELIKKEKLDEKFVEGCMKNGIGESVAKEIFKQIEYFGGYGFNKSHSVTYSYMSLQTIYLKIYYPIEYMCSLLTIEINNQDKGEKLDSYIQEATRMGILVKQPDINKSRDRFIIEKGVSQIAGQEGKEIEYLRAPFTILDGVGDKAVEEIVANQPYSNLRDFLFRVDLSKVNSKVYKGLALSGCMREAWGVNNSEKLIENYEIIRPEVDKQKKNIKKEIARLDEYEGSIFDVMGGDGLKI
jgi:DNA-directed DNA polymerase III PolC